MKKLMLVLLGLLSAGMAYAAFNHAARFHGDWFDLAFGALFVWGAWAAFRKAKRLTPPQSPESRPWDSTKPPTGIGG